MKKISHLAAILVLAASFSVPLLVNAQTQESDCNAVGKTYSAITGTCVPLASSSSGGGINTSALKSYSDSIIGLINTVLVPVLMAIAFIVFLWGIFKYFIYGASNESDKAEGRKFAMWGIVGFVIIFSVWGLVNIVKDTLVPSTSSSTHPQPPTI